MGIELIGSEAFIKVMLDKAKKLESKADKTRILKAGAEPIRKAMSEKAPRSSLPKAHMADNIIISDVKEGDFVNVGPEKSFFYGSFQEFGTKHHPPHPFAEPSYHEKKDEALNAMAAETKKVIEGD